MTTRREPMPIQRLAELFRAQRGCVADFLKFRQGHYGAAKRTTRRAIGDVGQSSASAYASGSTKPACVHLGGRHPDFTDKDGHPLDPNRERRLCGGCIVHECEMHKLCTIRVKYKSAACCEDCADHEPR